MGQCTITLHCKVGDEVFGIRIYKGAKVIRPGIVTEIYFTEGMRCCIVVKGVCRGVWEKNVFPTHEAAEAYLEGGKNA